MQILRLNNENWQVCDVGSSPPPYFIDVVLVHDFGGMSNRDNNPHGIRSRHVGVLTPPPLWLVQVGIAV